MTQFKNLGEQEQAKSKPSWLQEIVKHREVILRFLFQWKWVSQSLVHVCLEWWCLLGWLFPHMKCPSLSLLISFRSILSVISKWCLLAPGPIWLEDSVNPFYSMALLKAQCVSCRGQVDGFCFTIHSVSLYLLLESWGNWYF